MKKIFTTIIVMVMIVCAVSVASASTEFEFWAQSQYENNANIQCDSRASAYETKHDLSDNETYIRHWVYDGSNDYTNFFRIVTYGTTTYRGQKWVTVGKDIPITSANYSTGEPYSPAGRGNSKHYTIDGNTRVSLHGIFFADY